MTWKWHKFFAREYTKDEIASTVWSLSSTIKTLALTIPGHKDVISRNWTNSRYLNHHHGYNLTRDLRGIENKKLYKIKSKGPNYREPKAVNREKSKESISQGLDSLIKGKLLSDKKIPEESLIPCKSAVIRLTKKNSKLNTRIKPSKSNHILKRIDAITCLEALQKKFVLVPIDKASNNAAILCQQYYDEVILNETGVVGHEK